MTQILRFDSNALVKRLDSLPPLARAEFGYRSAERLYPLYLRLATATGRGGADELRSALDELRKDLDSGGRRLSDLRTGELVTLCERLVPPEDTSWTEMLPPAQNAAAAAAFALRCRRTGKSQEAAWAAQQGYEAADYVATHRADVDLNAPGAEGRMLADPVVQDELRAQLADLRAIEAIQNSP